MSDSEAGILGMFASFERLLDEMASLYKNHSRQLEPPELGTFPDTEKLHAAYSMGILSWEACCDHIFCFLKRVRDPICPIALFTCVRGAIESAAIGTWILDPTIDARTRAARQFSFEFYGQAEYLKMAQESGKQAKVHAIFATVDGLAERARALGFTVDVANGNGQIAGHPWPGIIELTEMALGLRTMYRVISSVPHGHHWALRDSRFLVINHADGHNMVEKSLPSIAALILLTLSFEAFAMVLVNVFTLFEWEPEPMRVALNRYCDETKYLGTRFWLPCN